MIKHVVEEGNLSLLVSNDWELQIAATDVVDILDPAAMALNGVCRQTNQLDTTLCELWLQFCKSTQLGGTDRCVIFRMREEDDPSVADELVEVNGAFGGIGLEVGGDGTEAEAVSPNSQHRSARRVILPTQRGTASQPRRGHHVEGRKSEQLTVQDE